MAMTIMQRRLDVLPRGVKHYIVPLQEEQYAADHNPSTRGKCFREANGPKVYTLGEPELFAETQPTCR